MPLDALGALLQMLEFKRLCYTILQSEKLRYRKAPIHFYPFQGKLTEDALCDLEEDPGRPYV